MRFLKSNSAIATSLLLAVLLWGGNNAGTKWLVTWWGPVLAGATRFLFAGLILLALLRWTDWFGRRDELTPELKRQLWWQGGFSLAIYVVCFNWALRCTSASHVALYLAASP
ncbi:MAG TPA: DMT family transporter, partial [Verrucomicrobiae bacterium]|nr:DMT family transporter [Verrucomicrobiae bacterium]